MARKTVWGMNITESQMNSGLGYRLELGYGTFTIAPQKGKDGSIYYYSLKRVSGKLFKVYIGKAGEIDREKLYAACNTVSTRAHAQTGRPGRNNRASL